MNRKIRRNKKANKIANWIVNTILKLDNFYLINFYILIQEELKKRGIEDVRSCSEFYD